MSSAQERLNQWIQDVSKLDLSKKEDLMAIYRAATELNRITQEAEKGIEW
jgi:hypothetical protein